MSKLKTIKTGKARTLFPKKKAQPEVCSAEGIKKQRRMCWQNLMKRLRDGSPPPILETARRNIDRIQTHAMPVLGAKDLTLLDAESSNLGFRDEKCGGVLNHNCNYRHHSCSSSSRSERASTRVASCSLASTDTGFRLGTSRTTT